MITIRGVRCQHCKFLPPKGYRCITLFGIIFFRGTKQEMCNYFYSKIGAIGLNHERIHILQGEELGWIVFYTLYLWYYLKNRFHCSHSVAYHLIPFELEAYDNQEDLNYKDTHWEDYLPGKKLSPLNNF